MRKKYRFAASILVGIAGSMRFRVVISEHVATREIRLNLLLCGLFLDCGLANL